MGELSGEIELRCRVLLAFQWGLLGEVTPNLRGVIINWTDCHIDGVFVFDGNISEREEEIVSDVEGEVVAHFLHHTINVSAVELAAPANLNHYSVGVWVYRRSE